MIPQYDGEPCDEWSGTRDRDGYPVLRVQSERAKANGSYYRHRQVAFQTYGPPPGGKRLCCHTCDNPICVRPSHLFWGSDSDNMSDMRAKGRWEWLSSQSGQDNNASKLMDDEAWQIREMYGLRRFSQDDLAEMYGVSQGTISLIVLNKIYIDANYVPPPTTKVRSWKMINPDHETATLAPNGVRASKVSFREASEIRDLCACGLFKQEEIASFYGVTQVAISSIYLNNNFSDPDYKVPKIREHKIRKR